MRMVNLKVLRKPKLITLLHNQIPNWRCALQADFICGSIAQLQTLCFYLLSQALIAADFKRVDLKLGEPNDSKLLCRPHGLEKCETCEVDFTSTNALSRLFVSNPQLICPPPPQVVQPQRSQAINKTKDQGNVSCWHFVSSLTDIGFIDRGMQHLFKAKKMKDALAAYTLAANIAVDRLPWEPSMLMKEELATVLSNRSAAYCAVGDYISALVDADLVIQLKRPWSKGHFRKAKALEELKRFEEAKEAVLLGLVFEPSNSVSRRLLLLFMLDMSRVLMHDFKGAQSLS
jgi:translocation protein SEC72